MAQNPSNEVLSSLIDDNSKRSFFDWWYNLASLPEAARNASLKERERVRRSRLTATILFGIFCILIVVFFMGFIIHNYIISAVMVGGFCSTSICTFCNRKGFMTIAGLILFLQVDAGQSVVFTHLAGGIDLGHMMLLDQLFIISEMVAISFFPSSIMFLGVLFNCVLLGVIFAFAPETPALYQISHSAAGFQYYADPFLVEGIVAIVSFLWTRSMNNAIERADRAQVIAELEHQIADQMQSINDEKHQLEQNILYIQDIHVRVANGDLNVQMPITQDNVLWPLAVSFNTLLARYRQLYQAALVYQRLEAEIQVFTQVVHNARTNFMPIHAEPHGTTLDQLYYECNNNILVRYEGPRYTPEYFNPTGGLRPNQPISGMPYPPNPPDTPYPYNK